MIVLLISLLALGIVVAVFAKLSKTGGSGAVVTGGTCATCNGEDAKCEQECMLEAAVKDIEYYDDEELDDFRGRPSDGYTDEEAERFRDVCYTMRQGEVAGWCRSLTLRGIELPNQVKDEVMMMIER